jgi:hypothetical protein
LFLGEGQYYDRIEHTEVMKKLIARNLIHLLEFELFVGSMLHDHAQIMDETQLKSANCRIITYFPGQLRM